MVNGILITDGVTYIEVDAQSLAFNPADPANTLPFTKIKIAKSDVKLLNFKHESFGVDVCFGIQEPYLYKYELFDDSLALTSNLELYDYLKGLGLAG